MAAKPVKDLPTPTTYEDASSLLENLRDALKDAQATVEALPDGDGKDEARAIAFDVESDFLLANAYVDAFGAPAAIRADARRYAKSARDEIAAIETMLSSGKVTDEGRKGQLLAEQNSYFRAARAWDAVATAEPGNGTDAPKPSRGARKNSTPDVPATSGAGAAVKAAPAESRTEGGQDNRVLVVRAMQPIRWRAGRQFTSTETRIPIDELSLEEIARIEGDPVLAVRVEPAN